MKKLFIAIVLLLTIGVSWAEVPPTAPQPPQPPVSTISEIDALIDYGGGTIYTQATIAAAYADVGIVDVTTIVLRSGTWVISTNFDLSAYTNVTLKIVPGAILQIATGTTMTIPKIDENGSHQRFDCVGTGIIDLVFCQSVDPRWFGAIVSADNSINSRSAIQKAFDTGKPILIAGGNYYLGILTTGNFLTITANNQCVLFKDNSSLTGYGTNNVENNAGIIVNDSFSGCYLYSPCLISNGTVLTTSDRDSPYGYLVLCTTATVKNTGIVNGKGVLLQAMFQTSKTTMDAYEVNGIFLEYYSEDCFYGVGLSATGNNVNGTLNVRNSRRPFILYGCEDVNLDVYTNYTAGTQTMASALIGAGVISANTKDTSAINIKLVYRGISGSTGVRCIFSVQHFVAQAIKCKLRNINLYYDDYGAAVGGGISFQYYVDNAIQNSYTGNIFDQINIKGHSVYAFDLTAQGSTPGGLSLTQTIKGSCDLTMLTIPTMTYSYDPTIWLFNGPRPVFVVENITFSPTIFASNISGTPTYTATRWGRARKIGKSIFFDLAVGISDLVDGPVGQMVIGLGSLGDTYPAVTATGYNPMILVTAANLTYTGSLIGSIVSGGANIPLSTFASNTGFSPVAVDTAFTVYATGSYETFD